MHGLSELTGLTILVAPGILVWQAFQWLKTGVWIALPLSTLMDYFEIHVSAGKWVGMQKIVDWVLDVPLSCVALVAALIIIAIAAVIEVEHEKRWPAET